MSTFIKSAAMRMLSKTLQTLLYKYLSDVDVEGVNLPSFYGNRGGNDGHSGWGVRLSNVVLREGAKLLDLPGQLSKEKMKKKKKKTKMKAEKQQRRSLQRENTQSSTSFNHCTSKNRTKTEAASTHQKKGTTSCLSTPLRSTSNNLPISPVSNLESDGTDETIATQSTAASTTVTGATATAAAAAAAAVAPGVTTSHKKSSLGWFSWYSSETKTETEDVGKSQIDDPKQSTDRLDSLIGILPPSSQAANAEGGEGLGTDEALNNEEIEEEEELKEEEDFTDSDVNDSMVLRLGRGSRIGTLDVRLVGKNIHVYVEDALICIEVVRMASSDQTPVVHDENELPEGRNPSSPHSDSTTTAATTTAARGSSTIKQDGAKAVGDRVLAENAIARMLSAFPNLFLRDIRIQLLIRNDLVFTADEMEGSQTTMDSTPTGENDSIIDISIELLSVTDGEDFLAKFRTSTSSSNTSPFDFMVDDDSYDLRDNEALQQQSEYDDLNEYLVKRIRTGRGPEGGVCIRVLPPGQYHLSLEPDGHSSTQPQWARSTWTSMTDFCMLRCSGLDIHARIFLGIRNDDSGDMNSSWFATFDDYDYPEFDVDSMLFGGVDYVAPGPQPPLPPMSNSQEAALSMESEKFWTHDGATVYRIDDNGVQSSDVASSFHRVARGFLPTILPSHSALPCEDSIHCWKIPGNRHSANKMHRLDDATPMGGLVLHFLTRDPLEINIDRSSLLVLGDLVGFLTKRRVGRTDRNFDNSEISSERSKNSSAAGAGPASFADHLGRVNDHVDESSDSQSESLSNAFPSYMQPEKIQILGMHCTDLILRLHVMQPDNIHDNGLSFCFWDVAAKCITVDYQSLQNTPEKSYKDLRFDIGYLTWNQYKGIENKMLLSLGLRQRVVDFDGMTIETLKTREAMSDRPPWPSTAAALLEVQPPLETLAYEERDRHALQFRYVTVRVPDECPDRVRTTMNVRFGPAAIDASYNIKDQVPDTISSARSYLFGPSPEVPPSEPYSPSRTDQKLSPAIKAILKYKFQLDGGRIVLFPRLNAKMPLTVISGERSDELGFSFETVLDRVCLSYGERCIEPRALDCGLTLKQLAELPESVRLRILLILSDRDVGALELALHIKRETNSFLRCRAVNKGILRAAKRSRKPRGKDRSKLHSSRTSTHAETTKAVSQRQEIMLELLKLDDETLNDLLMVHRRYQKSATS